MLVVQKDPIGTYQNEKPARDDGKGEGGGPTSTQNTHPRHRCPYEKQRRGKRKPKNRKDRDAGGGMRVERLTCVTEHKKKHADHENAAVNGRPNNGHITIKRVHRSFEVFGFGSFYELVGRCPAALMDALEGAKGKL
jgi:hypothetical protein